MTERASSEGEGLKALKAALASAEADFFERRSEQSAALVEQARDAIGRALADLSVEEATANLAEAEAALEAGLKVVDEAPEGSDEFMAACCAIPALRCDVRAAHVFFDLVGAKL